MIPKKILTLILIIQSTFDANKKGIFLQIFMNLTKKRVCHQELIVMFKVKDVQA
jgi:hypothetical protein